MKNKKLTLILSLASFFSLLFGASSKVWDYSFGSTFLIIGLILLLVTLGVTMPKGDSFLDKWG